ncbi:MAG: lipoyl(octanoyl) transferase LipB [Gammaproteobacteria bacterium]
MQNAQENLPTDLPRLVVRRHGRVDYRQAWQDMQAFTDRRDEHTPDELWLLEHPPVFTLGRNGKDEHIHHPGNIPVIRVDRGGQVTYHGPGQLVVYCLLDLHRRRLGVQSLVHTLEQTVIDLLAGHGVVGERRLKAPGVYAEDSKVAALGLRVRRGCSFHGLALNVDMDLAPFARINPCGYAGLEVTQLRDLGISLNIEQAGEVFQARFEQRLNGI